MANKFVFGFRTHSNDLLSRSYPIKDTSTVADWTGFVLELEKWLVPNVLVSGGYFDEEADDDGQAPSSPLAQKDLRAIAEVTDTVTGSSYKRVLPMPDLSKANDVGANTAFVVSNGVTVFNPDHADYALLKTEIETHFLSDNDNPVTLSRIYIEE